MTGNPGKRALNKREPKPSGNLADAPDWFNDEQKATWAYAIASSPFGLLKRVDRSVLVVWTVAEVLHRQAAIRLTTAGMLVKTPNGMPVQSPLLSIVNKQAAIMMKAAAEMGFTPASRSRVEVDKPDDSTEDEFFGAN